MTAKPTSADSPAVPAGHLAADPVSEYRSARTRPEPTATSPDSADHALLAIGAIAAVVGVVVEVGMGFLHPSHAQPNQGGPEREL